MKRIIIFIVILACMIGIYFSYSYRSLDPNIKSIEDMQVMKMKPKAMLLIDKVYLEKDNGKISSILGAFKYRSRENNTVRINTYNYAIDMRIKNKKEGSFVSHKYAIWIENDEVYITIPSISHESYRLQSDSAKLIKKYLNEVNYTEL